MAGSTSFGLNFLQLLVCYHIPPPPFLLQNVILKSNFLTKIEYDASKQHVFILEGEHDFQTIEEKTLQACTSLNKAFGIFGNFNPFISTSKSLLEVKFLNKNCVQCL
jgi:hypothetical protein